ncbi:unnamed protein product, partial [Chrysoparadoxa australica]
PHHRTANLLLLLLGGTGSAASTNHMSTFDEARQFLQKESKDGVNLYDHLTSVLLKVISERPENASESFEHISASVKEAKAKVTAAVSTVSREQAKSAQLDWVAKSSALFTVPDEPPEGGPALPDILDEANMWQWAGVSLGQMETYRIYLAVKKLAESLPGEHETLRFWGRITTRDGNYLIAEGRTLDEQLGEFDESAQEGSAGANRYTYWTSKGPGQSWVQLPPVTQAHITASRAIKKYLTGDLGAPVRGYPPFPGTERNLLRALIARISAGTAVSPSGFFEVDEEAEPVAVKVAEAETINESFPKPTEELMTPDGWVHHEMELNVLGRNRPMPEKLDDEGNPIEEEDPPEEVPPLRSLAEDAEGTWGFRTCPAGAGATANSFVVAKNLLWPGAYAVSFGRRFTNIYVGDGIKYQAEPYQIPLPPAIQSEWAPPEEEENPLLEPADLLEDPNPPPGEGDEED